MHQSNRVCGYSLVNHNLVNIQYNHMIAGVVLLFFNRYNSSINKKSLTGAILDTIFYTIH